MTGYFPSGLRNFLISLSLTLLACVPLPTETPPPQTATPYLTPTSTPSQVVGVSPVKRYSTGKVVPVNRLEVYWNRNPECTSLNVKYDRTTRNIVVDNIRIVLRNYSESGVLEEGFERQNKISMRLLPDSDHTFVRESNESEATLMRLGQEIYDNACNDPEYKTSFR